MATNTSGESPQMIDSSLYGAEVPERSVEEERRHRKTRLVGALRIFADMGYTEGVAGHLTARDPEFPDTFWVNPYSLHFSQVRVSDLVRIDMDGHVLDGSGPVNKAAFAIHHAIHEARPDAVSAVHAHTTWGRAWSTTGRTLAPLVQEACAFYGNLAVLNDYDGIITEPLQAEAVAKALGGMRAVTLMHHGNITVGGSVEEAVWWFLTLDRCCKIEMSARATGLPVHEIPKEWAEVAAEQFGNPAKARVSFEMLFDVASTNYPDMFD